MDEILSLIDQHEEYRSRCLNLVASENVLSQNVRKALASDFASRYVANPKFYAGTKYMDEVIRITEKRGASLFGSKYCSVNPIGGHIALMATLTTLCKRGDKVMSPPPVFGGYGGFGQSHSLSTILGLEVSHLPFDEKRFNIDASSAAETIRREKPRAVVLGASIILFPHPVRQLSEEVHRYGGKLVYDGSHVMGLIAGGAFQQPLSEGADVLLGSTHKSLFGPQGGMIASNEEEFYEALNQNYVHVTQDNPHPNRIAALGVALGEAIRYGREYARAVVNNSKRIAQVLAEHGFPVSGEAQGYTESHQVYLSYDGWKKGSELRDKLEEAGILVDAGVRIGTSEITRRGYTVDDAVNVSQAIIEASRSNIGVAKEAVERLVESHPRVLYC